MNIKAEINLLLKRKIIEILNTRSIKNRKTSANKIEREMITMIIITINRYNVLYAFSVADAILKALYINSVNP